MSFVSYAQNFEDVMLWRALKDIENGFYIDIGAQDPIVDSVSLAFYEHGWRGIHVEPTEFYSRKLIKSRPDEVVKQIAIGSNDKKIEFYEFSGTGLSTADKKIAEQHEEEGFVATKKESDSISLDSLLDLYAKKEIHWLKIDVEGFEKKVIESWVASNVRPWILVVESTQPLTNIETHYEWEFLVLEKGYKFAYFDGLNRFYVHESHSALIMHFKIPPNIFDDFMLSGSASQPFCQLIKEKAEAKVQEAEAKAQAAEAKAQQAEAKAQAAKAKAQGAEVKVQKTEAKVQEAEAKVQEAEAKAQQAEAKVQQDEVELAGIYSSRSWRITAPLRWIVHQVRLLQNKEYKTWFKVVFKKLANRIFKATFMFVNTRPRLRNKLVMVASKIGIYDGMKNFYHRLQKSSVVMIQMNDSTTVSMHELTPQARQIYADLNAAINENKEQE